MEVTSLHDGIVLIQSSKVTDRTAGLKKLIDVLKQNRGKLDVKSMGNKSWFNIFETLFKCVEVEKKSWSRGKSKSTKAAANLPLAATAVRQTIISGVRLFKSTTADKIIRWIAESLPAQGDNDFLVTPLAEDLPKALKALLEYQPHVERLPVDVWETAVDLCVQSLHSLSLESDVTTEVSFRSFGRSSSRARTSSDALNGSTIPNSRDSTTRGRAIPDSLVQTAEDFLICLQLLATPPNAPLLEKAELLLTTLVDILQRRIGRGYAAAWATINAVLAKTALSSIELTKRTIKNLLPLMKSSWPDVALRDELIITLIHTESHLSGLLASKHEDTTASDLEALIEYIYGEYRKRQETGALQYLEDDHLTFRYPEMPGRGDCFLSTYAFALSAANQRCENLWGTVSLIAHFSFMLDSRKRNQSRGSVEGDGLPSKRMKITQHFQEYLSHVLEPRSNAKRAALQVVAFLVQEGPLDESELQQVVERLTPCIADENPVHSTWAMIGLAAAAFQSTSRSPELVQHWVSAWQSASRAITSTSSSRAACYLMDILLSAKILPFPMVSEIVQTMLLSIDISGPALVTESSSSLLATVIQKRTSENPTSFDQTADRILYWLLAKWTPSLFPERAYSSLYAHHCNSSDVLRIVYACLDKPLRTFDASPFAICGPIAQARQHALSYDSLMRFLVLSDNSKDFRIMLDEPISIRNSGTSGRRPPLLESRILDFCFSEVEKIRQRWKEWTREKELGITADMMRLVANFCFAASTIIAAVNPENTRLVKLQPALTNLIGSFAEFLAKEKVVDQYKIDAVLEVCVQNIPDIRRVDRLDMVAFDELGISSVAQALSKALEDRKVGKESFYVQDDDFMEDDDHNSQLTGALSNPENDVPRQELVAQTNIASLRASCCCYMKLISSLVEAESDGQAHDEIPFSFFEYLVTLSEADLLHSRPFLKGLLSRNCRITMEACQELLGTIQDRLLDPSRRDFNTSEVVHGLMVEILTGTIATWCEPSIDEVSQELYENAEELYGYYIQDMEKGGVRRSPGLQIALADFLLALHRRRRDFPASNRRKIPSVRTSLFELLNLGDITARYHIIRNLPEVFESYVLSEHEKVFEDVRDSLPNKIQWIEGIALRLLALSHVGSRWYTLLRVCVYCMFETAGLVEGASNHAQRCIIEVAHARQFETPQELFKLFAPQILYSWATSGRANNQPSGRYADIPFSIFQYASIAELLQDVESEAVAQAVMLCREDELKYLEQTLATSTKDLLVRNFARAAAYTLSYDISKGSGKNQAIPSGEKLLISLAATDQYTDLVQAHYPRVVGIMLQSMANEDKFDKAVSHRPAFEATAKAMAQMKQISHSKSDPTQDIQPCFSAFYLFDQLDRLCRRMITTSTHIWTPKVYTYVMRMLLSRIHVALGSLYARSMIRKIRILVAFAGKVAFTDYPLQMTLQALRPFLTDVQCAEDALGITQYLLHHGTSSLATELSFVTGIGLSILISIRVFLGSTQDSTTQESQHSNTMSKAQSFHSWLTRYLEAYASSVAVGNGLTRSDIKAFRSITTAASRVRAEGNSVKGSEESKLLLELLDDVRSGRRLLNPQSREVALDLLCQNFRPAPTSHEDALGVDADAFDFAAQVWESCHRPKIGDGYLLWAARVLGRTFSSYGEVKRPSRRSKLRSTRPYAGKEFPGQASRRALVQQLLDMRLSDDRKEVGLAEEGLRLVFTRMPQDTVESELGNIVPPYIIIALKLSVPDEQGKTGTPPPKTLQQAARPTEAGEFSAWVRDLALALCHGAPEDAILGSLSRIILGIDGMAQSMLPYILHLVLLAEFDKRRDVRMLMSSAFMSWFEDCNSTNTPYVKILLHCLLYLRTQEIPKELTRVDRDKWLELDYLAVAQAATTCGMYKSALLFAETYASPVVTSSFRRQSSINPAPKIPTETQIAIYKNLDEPDSFYGVDQGSSLSSVLERLDYEGNGMKSLLFRGARTDSQMRQKSAIDPVDSRGMVRSLIMLNMNSITQSLLSNDQFRNFGDDVVDSALHTARRLGQWDIRAPDDRYTESNALFKAFQGLHYASDSATARNQLDEQFLATMKNLSQTDRYSSSTKALLRTLAVLNEADEVVASSSPDDLVEIWDQMKARQKWMLTEEFDDVRVILSSRETLFSVLSTNPSLLTALRAKTAAIRHMEVDSLISSSVIYRKHGALQEALANVTYLSDLVPTCRSVGLDIEAKAQHEAASVLWEHGEAETSIRMRQHLVENRQFDSQVVDISLPVLLSKLGHHLAEARLDQPQTIIKKYLEPAVKELKGQTQGLGPGQVFHEYALFCDKQISNPDAKEDLTRMKLLMERKKQEATEFYRLGSAEKDKRQKENYKKLYIRAHNWFKLDKAEYDRLQKNREEFLQKCLENYLLSLQASDEYNTDVLRVFALWLEYADLSLANKAVGHHLSKVPSGKFALLMNQLSSRLQAEATEFQRLLSDLVLRICSDHPYHGMHQIFAMQNKLGLKYEGVRSKDESAKSRQQAAASIAQRLAQDRHSGPLWSQIMASDTYYHNLAMAKNDQMRMGRELSLDKFPEAREVLRKIPDLKVPPATLSIEIRPNCNYTDVPKIARFRPKMSIANGLSAPKIITAEGTDGRPYKQLFKSGNDDLRQDAIMEQVFDQVSRLLKNHTATRIRNLGIRTYKVLPLSTESGLMEFVPNTIPLNNYLMPAHERYYPNDWKGDKCRREITNCSTDSQTNRLKIWQKVAANFNPVMRFFFIERFEDPDEWFEKRLAYTRSTAAISILGHVLGLGDRHCHNILLDEMSGEVVHIDLGVAFEAGRLLPVPEVVPFRLTRDLVDAMGYTKTEGVFRRCCEFTMDTLREERESIMTLLNVLRYDPLVNWSVPPTKAKRMQEGQETAAATAQNEHATAAAGGTGSVISSAQVLPQDGGVGANNSQKKKEEQAGEAGRALSVVEKKLSKTLSTRTTVNELIQAAADEKNLAVLYSGWASYA